MSFVRLGLLLFFSLLSYSGWAQQPVGLTATPPPPQRDPQALTVLNQALVVAGGSTKVGAVQDCTASGTITYYWAGQEIQGTVSVKSHGLTQLSIKAAVPQGVRTVVISNGIGSIKDINGQIRTIQNTVNLGSLTLPIANLVATLNDNTSSINYIGLETAEGEQVHHIRIQEFPSTDNSLNITMTNLGTRDFYVDASTFRVKSTLDYTQPKGRIDVNIPHMVQFSDYHLVNGIQVPFSINQLGAGQQTSTIQLSQVTFNNGLTDADFQILN